MISTYDSDIWLRNATHQRQSPTLPRIPVAPFPSKIQPPTAFHRSPSPSRQPSGVLPSNRRNRSGIRAEFEADSPPGAPPPYGTNRPNHYSVRNKIEDLLAWLRRKWRLQRETGSAFVQRALRWALLH